METREQTGQQLGEVQYADGSKTSGVIDAEKARPIMVALREPVDNDTVMLDLDHLTSVEVPAQAEWAKSRTVAELEGIIRLAENVADDHDNRARSARSTANLFRQVLHDTANATDRPQAATTPPLR